MGRLYQKTVSGEKNLAFFEGGRAQRECSSDETAIFYNSSGQIYYENPTRIVATCNPRGSICQDGTVLATCEDGKIYEGSSRKTALAWYDGDMYGAAAALMLLGNHRQTD